MCKNFLEAALVFVLVSCLSGCAGQSRQHPAPQVPEGDVTLGPILLDYTRSGGIAGFHDHLVLDRTGIGRVERNGRSSVIRVVGTPITELLAAFEKAGFGQLEKEYLAQGADLFEYTITYKGHTVRAMDGAVPEQLEPVLRRLNRIVDQSGVPPR